MSTYEPRCSPSDWFNAGDAVELEALRCSLGTKQCRRCEQRMRRKQRRIPAALRDEMLDGCCHYCGDEATTIDHVMPVSRGGTSDRANLVAACRRCNLEKLDFTPDEWRAWREEIGEPWPPEPRVVAYRRIIEG